MIKLTSWKIEASALTRALYVKDWFQSNEKPIVYLRYYLLPFQPKTEFYIPGIKGDAVEFSDTHFCVNLVYIADHNYEHKIPILLNAAAGQHKISIEQFQRKLPDANYILISTPLRSGDEAHVNASTEMDGLVAMLRLVGGNKVLHQMVRETIVDLSTGEMKTLTPQVLIPNEIGEPTATAEIWSQFSEVTNAISALNEPNRSRIALAIQLVEKAYSSHGSFKFICYWVALEVAANTHSKQRILNLLTRAYGRKNSYVQNDLGFDNILDIRTALVHDGKYYAMPSDVERYIQCLFLDVVRERLGLVCKNNMAAMMSGEFDVSRLDLEAAQANILNIDISLDHPVSGSSV